MTKTQQALGIIQRAAKDGTTTSFRAAQTAKMATGLGVYFEGAAAGARIRLRVHCVSENKERGKHDERL